MPNQKSLPGNPLQFGTPFSPGVLSSPTIPTSVGNSLLPRNSTSLRNSSSFAHLPSPANLLLRLDPRLQGIEEPLTVTPHGRLSRLLNKKRSRKDDNFERSTCREPSQFEHAERGFSSSQQRGIRRSGIRGNAVRRGQNRPQSRTDQSTSGIVAGIPTEMTSVFSI